MCCMVSKLFKKMRFETRIEIVHCELYYAVFLPAVIEQTYMMLQLLYVEFAATRSHQTLLFCCTVSTEHMIGKLLSQLTKPKHVPDGLGNIHCKTMFKLTYRICLRGIGFSCASYVDKICKIFILRSFSMTICKHEISATLSILKIVVVLTCR